MPCQTSSTSKICYKRAGVNSMPACISHTSMASHTDSHAGATALMHAVKSQERTPDSTARHMSKRRMPGNLFFCLSLPRVFTLSFASILERKDSVSLSFTRSLPLSRCLSVSLSNTNIYTDDDALYRADRSACGHEKWKNTRLGKQGFIDAYSQMPEGCGYCKSGPFCLQNVAARNGAGRVHPRRSRLRSCVKNNNMMHSYVC